MKYINDFLKDAELAEFICVSTDNQQLRKMGNRMKM